MLDSILKQVQGWLKIKGDTDGTNIGNVGDSLKTNITSSALPDGAATESTLSSINAKDFATETKLEQVRVLLNSLDGKDFSTQTTLEAARLLLASIDSKDFANESTLELVRLLLVSLDAKDFATNSKLTDVETVLNVISAKDFSTEATLELVRLLLVSLDSKDFATQTTLSEINTKLNSLGQKTMANSVPVVTASDQVDTLRTILDADGDPINSMTDSLFNKRILTEAKLKKDETVSFYGRVRATHFNQVIETFYTYDKRLDVWNELIAGASSSSTWLPNRREVELTVGDGANDRVLRRMRRRIRYIPNQPTVATMVINFDGVDTDRVKSAGIGDDQDGLRLELDESQLKIVRRTSTSGTPVDIPTNNEFFNLDKLDGTGASGHTFNPSNSYLLVIEYVWQGVGGYRFGFQNGNETVYFHQETFFGNSSGSFLSNPNLPIFTEIRNKQATTGTASMRNNCAAGGYDGQDMIVGFPQSADRDGVIIGVGTANYVPIISLRLNPANRKRFIEVIDAKTFIDSNGNITSRVLMNPTLTGTSWVNRGIAQFDVSSTALTGGTQIGHDYVIGRSQSNWFDTFRVLNRLLGENIDGTQTDIITLAGRALGGNQSALGSIQWKEL